MRKVSSADRDGEEVLRGVDSEIDRLSPARKKEFKETYAAVRFSDLWLSQRGLSTTTDPQVVKKILYNEMFYNDFSFNRRERHTN